MRTPILDQNLEVLKVFLGIVYPFKWLNVTHVFFDQGLDFLLFEQGHRGQIRGKPKKTHEHIKQHTHTHTRNKN